VLNTSAGTHRGSGSRLFLLAVAGAAAFIALSGLPSSASASSIDCFGKLKTDEEIAGYDYEFHCTEKVLAYSIYTSKPVEYFGTEVNVFAGSTNAPAAVGQRFSCEGGIPDRGFGCFVSSGQAAASPFYTLQGEFSTSQQKPCDVPKKDRFKTFLVVATELFNSSGKLQTTPTISEPIRLYGPKCPKGSAKPEKPGKPAGKNSGKS
jgi:hypothetical protein